MKTDLNEIEQYLSDGNNKFMGMTKIQMENFVFGTQITSNRLAKQFLTELNVRLDSIKSTKLDIEEEEAHKEILLEESSKVDNTPANQKLINVKIKKKENSINGLKIRLKQINHEVNYILESLNAYEDSIGMKIIDVDLNNEKEEREYWIKRLSKQAGLDLLVNGRISTGNLESLMVLPDNERDEVLKNSLSIVHSVNNQMGNIEKSLIENNSSITLDKNNLLGNTLEYKPQEK